MQAELAIQKQRMEQEQQRELQKAEETARLELSKQNQSKLQALQLETKALETEREQLEQKLLEATASLEATETKSSSQQRAQEEQLVKLEEALDQKNRESLLNKEQLEETKQQLAQAEQQLSEVEQQQESSSSESPRVHAGRYTAAEYRVLTEDEKLQVQKLREEQERQHVDDEKNDILETAAAESNTLVHPILGPVVEDLGYKRIHLVSAGRLGTIPIWEKQRIYRHNRAKSMVRDKWKSGMHLGLPGVICVYEDRNGKLAIIDGQHRVGMMMLLRDKQRQRVLEEGDETFDVQDDSAFVDFDNILVEVYPEEARQSVNDDSPTSQRAQELFLEINKAEPIKLVDMPGVAKAKDRQVITDAVDELYDRYPAMFSPSQRCRSPNVNVDNLRNSLFGAQVVKDTKTNTSKRLVKWMLEQNAILAKKYEGEQAQKNLNPRALNKAKANDFYLGLDSAWLFSNMSH